VLVVIAIAIAAVTVTTSAAFAGGPTATPTTTATPPSATPVATPTIALLESDVTNSAITWVPVPGTARHSIAATIIAVRISGAGVCEAPVQQENREILINQEVDGEISELSLDLPDVTPDEWLVVNAQLIITAFNAAGDVIAGVSTGRIAETCMRQAESVPSRQFPSTGTGAPQTTTNTNVVLGAILVTATASVLVLAGMHSLHARLRQRLPATRR